MGVEGLDPSSSVSFSFSFSFSRCEGDERDMTVP